MLTYERLTNTLDYNRETGVFIWKISNKGRVKAGDIAGYINVRGYRVICFGFGDKNTQKSYLAHRLARFYVNGVWPELAVDHINGVKDDNKWCNLREATCSQNNRNKSVSTRSQTGVKGVNRGKDGKFRVYICLGTYDTKEKAHEIYKEAARKLHGEFLHHSLLDDEKARVS